MFVVPYAAQVVLVSGTVRVESQLRWKHVFEKKKADRQMGILDGK